MLNQLKSMINWMTFKQLNLRLGYLLLGIFIILNTLYIRVILIRLPKELFLIINNQVNYRLCVIVVLGLITSLVILYQNLQDLLKKKHKTSFLYYMTFKLKFLIDNALLETYFRIFNLISNGYTKLANLIAKFYNTFGKQPETLFLFLNYIMRFLILSMFLIDVFWFFKLNYFYKSLILLCIPICINIWFYILKDFSKNIEQIQLYLVIEDKGIDPKTHLPITEYSPAEGYTNMDQDTLIYYANQYILLSKINGYLAVYNNLSTYYVSRFNIIIDSMYLIGWLYILSFNIINCMV